MSGSIKYYKRKIKHRKRTEVSGDALLRKGSQERLPGEVTFEQRPEWSKRKSHAYIQRESIPSRGTSKVKTILGHTA